MSQSMEYNPAKWMREQADARLREIFEEWEANKKIVTRLLSALNDAVGCWDENHSDVPEMPEVEALCLKWGYGAVLATAAELWRRKDPTGAHTVTACRYATLRAKKVLDEIAPAGPDDPYRSAPIER